MSDLLQSTDPSPIELINADSQRPVVLVCEHAGNAVPGGLDSLGISSDELNEHIGWDIGAGAVTRHLAALLGVRAMLQRYSRLVIDCNRPPMAVDSIPEVSHGITIPANYQLSDIQRQQRIDEVFNPYSRMLESLLTTQRCRLTLSIHSFAPVLNGVSRPWDISFLFRRDTSTSRILAESIQRAHPNLVVGMNEPYAVGDEDDWFVPNFGERLGINHSLIEIRNDHLRTAQGQLWWAKALSTAITDVLQGDSDSVDS